MSSLLVGWIVVLGCTSNDGDFSDVTEQFEISPSTSLSSTPSLSASVSNEDVPPPPDPNEPSPAHNSPETMKLLDSLENGSLVFTNFQGCQVDGRVEGDAPKGWFLYAWNDQRTVGLVLSIHQFPPQDLKVGNTRSLSVDEREAFVMIEIGETVDINFCVWNSQKLSMATVLESQIGTVEVFRSTEGYGATVSGVSLKDQYADRTLKLPDMEISPQSLVQPR